MILIIFAELSTERTRDLPKSTVADHMQLKISSFGRGVRCNVCPRYTLDTWETGECREMKASLLDNTLHFPLGALRDLSCEAALATAVLR